MKRFLAELKYAFYITVHPFKGFWDIKHEGMGSLRTAIVIFFAALTLTVGAPFFTEWFFLTIVNRLEYNFIAAFLSGAALFAAWCISNWCLTCLSDGEGTMKDIFTVTGYSMLPLALFQFAQIIVSRFFVENELALYNLIGSAGILWTAALMVFGVLVCHQYTLGKTIVVCAFTLAGIIIIIYLGILMLNLIQEMVMFVSVLIAELRYVYL